MTLAWTDPPGDPVAAIKLVNSLELVVSNLDDPTNLIVYYGNDIPAKSIYNVPRNPADTNSPLPNPDSINNVQNVFLPGLLATNYSITVIGRDVNVNAVSAQTNNAAVSTRPTWCRTTRWWFPAAKARRPTRSRSRTTASSPIQPPAKTSVP